MYEYRRIQGFQACPFLSCGQAQHVSSGQRATVGRPEFPGPHAPGLMAEQSSTGLAILPRLLIRADLLKGCPKPSRLSTGTIPPCISRPLSTRMCSIIIYQVVVLNCWSILSERSLSSRYGRARNSERSKHPVLSPSTESCPGWCCLRERLMIG